ncbi:histidinol-phosphatase [Schizosaccharomyces japonicus yFS275]|uniref:Histidinol-phosphatase n=1 Tax=Schizosaccharomyces japonicus (strain yFS275 / FY16936) TaxID=402676 RepID=B6JV46_SCHJY|nr:histidinol-phosphatase [Schizosaccharomyces japonicus yFS275]EEB05247.1 histidinol-phosphatase [Schizosaccharomyces japonicus yFS275]
MPISQHSHSGQFCLHASGNLEEVIREAIKQGFKTFAFTEHAPRDHEEDLYEEEKHLKVQDLFDTFDAYYKEARRLQQAYGDRINILVGSEIDYIRPESVQLIRSLLDKYDLDYIVGSVHHVHTIPIDFSPALWEAALHAVNDDYEQLFVDYFDHQYEMLRQLKPLVVAHFDLIRLFSPEAGLRVFADSQKVSDRVQRNIDFVNSYGGIFELNSSAFRKGWDTAYPKKDILQRILDSKALITLSDDSHGPAQVGLNYHRLKQYLIDQGVQQVAEIHRSQTEQAAKPTYKLIPIEQAWAGFVGQH